MQQANVPTSLKDRIFTEFAGMMDVHLSPHSPPTPSPTNETPPDPETPPSTSQAVARWDDPRVLVALAHLRALAPIHPSPAFLVNQFWSSLFRPVLLHSRTKAIVDLCRLNLLSFFAPGISFGAKADADYRSTPQNSPALSSAAIVGSPAGSAAAAPLHQDVLAVFSSTLLRCWMSEVERLWASIGDRVDAEIQRFKSAGSGSVRGSSAPKDSSASALKDGAIGSLALENIEKVLLEFSELHPKDFVNLLSGFCFQKETRLHALALLNKSTSGANLMAALAASDELFNVLVQIALHDVHPASVSGALVVLTLTLPYSVARASRRLELLHLVFLRVLHWDVLTHIVFKVIMPTVEADTLGAVSGLTPGQALSPWSVDIEMEDMEKVAWGQTSLMMSISSDSQDDPTNLYGAHLDVSPVTATPQYSAHKSSPSLSDAVILINASAGVRRSVDAFFTLLYGIFPTTTLSYLRTTWSSLASFSLTTSLPEDATALPWPEGATSVPGFESLPDPFARVRRRILDVDALDISDLLYRRLEHLASSHRLSPQSLKFPTPEEELKLAQSATFANLNPPPLILSRSLGLRVPRFGNFGMEAEAFPGSQGFANTIESPSEAEPYADKILSNRGRMSPVGKGTTVGEVARDVVLLSKRLREHVCDLTPSSLPSSQEHNQRHSVPYPLLDLLRLHQLIMMNEINLETLFRKEYMEAVLALRKQVEYSETLNLDRESVLKQQQHDLTTLTATVDQLRSEANAMRERYRKYEEDLNRRLKSAREGTKDAKDELATAKSRIAALEEALAASEAGKETAFKRINDLENEQQVTAPQLKRLDEHEQLVRSLTEQMSRVSERSTYESSTIEELTDRIVAMDLELAGSERELVQTREDLSKTNKLVEELSTKVSLYEKQIEEQGQTIKDQERIVASVRAVAASRIEAAEGTCKTFKTINFALEERVMELTAKLEEALAQ
ncbi:hypothetical protein HDU96_000137 [Phlyctochytrium bullatum]|nr:hypothetical protein HDU96_000137 [Phlyctochytrium bullatum]